VDKIAQLMGNLAFVAGAGAVCLLKVDTPIVLLLLTGFPSRRILSRHATRNAAVLAMNDSRHGTAQPGLIFGMELREFFFADVFNVLFHVFWVLGLLESARVDSEKGLMSQAGSRTAASALHTMG
jgi:hypothetical protein